MQKMTGELLKNRETSSEGASDQLWSTNELTKHGMSHQRTNFILAVLVLAVVRQSYETDVFKTTVVSGNDAFFKCEIPAHIGDMVGVVGWVDSQGAEILGHLASQGNWPLIVFVGRLSSTA